MNDKSPRRRLVSNLITGVSLLLNALSIGLAIYFYLQTQKEREPILYIEPLRAQVVDVSQPGGSKIEVLFEGKPIGQKNVTAAFLYFWNAGRESIESRDVFKPIEIILNGADEILDYSVMRQHRDGIINFEATVDHAKPNRVQIRFTILEQGDGATIQIIFTGDPSTTIAASGTIRETKAGIKVIGSTIGETRADLIRRSQRSNAERRIVAVLSVIAAALGLSLAIYGFLFFPLLTELGVTKYPLIITTVVSVVLAALAISRLIALASPDIPSKLLP